MSLIIKGMGTNVITKGFGSFEAVIEGIREVLRLISAIDLKLELVS